MPGGIGACRLALRRVETLNRIMQQSGKVFPQEAVDEANRYAFSLAETAARSLDVWGENAAYDGRCCIGATR